MTANTTAGDPAVITIVMVADSTRHRTAGEFAEELIPILQTLSNVSYLMNQRLDPLRTQELLRTESQVIEILIERVQRELENQR